MTKTLTPFSEAAHQLVKGLVWGDGPLPKVLHGGKLLVWRHHGLGMLQAELSDTLRVHIWHPKLVSPGMAWPRCVHDHRFDIASAVVVGEVIDVPVDVRKDHEFHPSGGWQRVKVVEIQHAKEQDRMVVGGCSTATHAEVLQTAIATRIAYGDKKNSAVTEYSIKRRVFHTTEIDGLAITVVHRSNFDERLARVLCAIDSDVTAISGIVRDNSLEHQIIVNSVLCEAAGAIAEM